MAGGIARQRARARVARIVEPEADRALFDALREGLAGADVEVHEVEADVNDSAFATAMADRLHELIQEAR